MESLPFWNIWAGEPDVFPPKKSRVLFVKNIHNKLEVSRSICPEVSGTARFFFKHSINLYCNQSKSISAVKQL